MLGLFEKPLLWMRRACGKVAGKTKSVLHNFCTRSTDDPSTLHPDEPETRNPYRLTLGDTPPRLDITWPIDSRQKSGISADQIRLLYIFPNLSGRIVCTRSTWHRSKAPAYTAISYTWGAANPECAITVDELSCPVPVNCFKALSKAQMHYSGHYIWIDLLCINQDDDVEKSCQVSAMGSIYQNAERVLACVGELSMVSGVLEDIFRPCANLPSTDDVEWPHNEFLACVLHGALTSLETALRDAAREQNHDVRDPVNLLMKGGRGGHPNTSYHSSDDYCPPAIAQAWVDNLDQETVLPLRHALFSYSQLEYWQRVWIVQEVIAAGTNIEICIASKKFSWVHVRLVLSLFGGEIAPYYKPYDWMDYSHQLYLGWLWADKIRTDFVHQRDHCYKLKYGWGYEAKVPSYFKPLFDLGYSFMHVLYTMQSITLGNLRLGDALSMVQKRRCLDPRDRLFAILSLVSAEERGDLTPDYNKTTLEIAGAVYHHECPMWANEYDQVIFDAFEVTFSQMRSSFPRIWEPYDWRSLWQCSP